MNRSEMISNLHALDERLWVSLDIEIVGASSAILQNALKRSSGDIDVINSSFPLNDPKMRRILDEIAKNPNDRESWLNQNAQEDILRRLPKNFKFDKRVIIGEKFNLLRPKLISKADFVICKLLIEEDKRRLHDLQDVKELFIDEKDVQKIYRKLYDISIEKHALSLKTEGLFKQIRQEFVLNEDDLPYSNCEEIARYYFSRYGVKVSQKEIDLWSEEMDQLLKNPATIIGELDYSAGEEIEHGNTDVASNDHKYRQSLMKDNYYGLEL